jgi:hypothetical protein
MVSDQVRKSTMYETRLQVYLLFRVGVKTAFHSTRRMYTEVFDNWVLRRGLYVRKRENYTNVERVLNGELHNLYSSSYIIRR